MRFDEHECIEKKQQLSDNYEGILGVLSKDISKIIENNRDFASTVQNQNEGKT